MKAPRRSLGSGPLGVLAARHVATLAALGPIAALIGAGEGLFIPASFAIMPSLLDGERLAAEPGAAVLLCLVGACNGLGSVTVLTVMQKWVPAGLLGRVMGALMLCSFGSFPLSVAVSGVLVHHLGPTPFFPVAGALVAVAILGGLTQREFRAFGATADGGDPVAVAQAADDPQAAEGSRK